MKKCYLDFEYNGTSNKYVNPVCSSDSINGDVWLYSNRYGKAELADKFLTLKNTHVFYSYSVVAEARAFLALGLNPLDFKWVDLHIEYRCLLNHNISLAHGKQLQNGRVVRTHHLPAYSDKNPKLNYSKPEHNLGACIFKLLGLQIDTEHKTAMRDLIISAPETFSEQEKSDIMTYCASDIKYLPKIREAMTTIYKKKLTRSDYKRLKKDALWRGEFAARTAIMEMEGYPIDVEATRNFSQSTGKILYDIQSFINRKFPEIAPYERKSKKDSRFAQKEKKIFAWIDTLPFKKQWPKTKGGVRSAPKYSLSLESFTKFFNYSHDYPDNSFGAQMVRLLKTKQSLNGFMPREIGSTKKSFWESVGSDGRVRPYLGIYGAQSSRSQPAATGFIPLKAAWMRALIVPPKGKAICGIDYGSQEFLLAGLVANDLNMISAYESGDVYLWAAKQWGIVPEEGTKAQYQTERDQCKAAVLGIGYGMGANALSIDITNKSGVETTYDQAAKYIQDYDESFHRYSQWKQEAWEEYQDKGYWMLPDGWVMWGDNDSTRSMKNCPIQGFGACIMRKAVQLAQDAGLKVIYTLHDAIYIEYDLGDFKSVTLLRYCMDRAFRFYFSGKMVDKANVRMDAKTWGYSDVAKYTEAWKLYEATYKINPMPMKVQNIYIDGRAEAEYRRFEKYFTPEVDLEELL